jgi:hypothetical protein
MIFTFWEGKMPAYIEMCMKTWKMPYTLLNYDNLNKYTDLVVDSRLKRFTLPQIADCVRVHVLRDNGGYWLDCDTIMLTDKLPSENMIGNSDARTQTIGYLYTEANSQMYKEWASYQDKVLALDHPSTHWSIMGNAFTDAYVKEHNEITICSVDKCWPETYMIGGTIPRHQKYEKFYFKDNYQLKDLKPTNMLMLHNSWTPQWYKNLSKEGVLARNCTLSNILREKENDN